MKKLTKILMAIVLLFSLCACEVVPVDKKINEAFECVDDDNNEKALEISDNLLKNNFSRMSLEQKCDLAVLYFDIFSELEDEEVGYRFMEVFDETMKNKQVAQNYYENKYGDRYYHDVFELLANANIMLRMAKNGVVDFEDIDLF